MNKHCLGTISVPVMFRSKVMSLQLHGLMMAKVRSSAVQTKLQIKRKGKDCYKKAQIGDWRLKKLAIVRVDEH